MNGSIRIGTKIDTKDFDKQIKYLEKEIQKRENENMQFKAGLDDGLVEDLTRDLAESEQKVKKIQNELRKVTGASDRLQLEKDLSKAQAEVTELKNVLHDVPKQIEIHMKSEAETEKLKNQLVDLKNKANETSSSVNKIPKNISANFDKSFKSIRNLAGALISIRGAYGLLSKASQAYLETDDTTTKQIKANWIGLGSMLEPVIKLITDLMRKATTGILYFMSCLTGTNYIEKANSVIMKANTKEIEKNTKAKKENLKFTAGFDEMNIASDNASSNSSSNSSSTTQMPLFSISDIGDSAKKSIEKIAGALNPIFDTVGDIIDWSKEHPGAVVTILGGMALVGLLGKIIGGPSTGLLGISGLLTGLMAIGVITIGIKVMSDDIKQSTQHAEDMTKKAQASGEMAKKAGAEHRNLAKQIIYSSEKDRELATEISDSIDKNYNKAQVAAKNWASQNWYEKLYGIATGYNKQYQSQMADNIEAEYQELKALEELYNRGRLNEEEIEMYKEKLIHFNNSLNDGSDEAYYLKDAYSRLYGGMSSLNKMTGDLDVMMYNLNEDVGLGAGIFAETTNAVKKMGIESQVGKGVVDELNKAINNIPSNKKVNVDATTINTAKTRANDLLTSLSKIGKSNIKATVQLNFKYAGDSVISTKDEAFNNLIKAMSSSTTKKYAASGAIVNNPGRGVPLTQDIITGERGAEGIIPLTDMSTMEQLGRAIGKYVVVSTTNVVNLDNRMIARENKKVQNEMNFANNWR